MNALPTWVAEASTLPLRFAQVREDPALDQEVVDGAGDGARVLMVASGGCTAAAIAASPGVARIHLVDPNPSQIALSRLKLRLLETSAPEARMALLGHRAMPAGQRAALLADAFRALGLQEDSLGPPGLVASLGPDQAGRYERLFAALQEALMPCRDEIEALLALSEPAEQARRAAPATPLGQALAEAFAKVMELPNLVALFGTEATRNPREPFASHFARRTAWVLGRLPAADNTFLWQMLVGRFPPAAATPWLHAAPPPRMPVVTWTVGPMLEALGSGEREWDVVHLSNILDWLSPDAARATLRSAWSALRPGGWIIVRQLNSTLDIAALGEWFEWDARTSAALLARDRSFFYRAIHVGRRA